MKHEPGRARPQWSISERAMGIISIIVIIAIGVVMMVDNYKIGAGWAKDGPQAGYFPFRIGVIICIAGAVVLFRLLADRNGSRKTFVTWDRLRLVLVVLVPTIAYVLVIQLAGIYVASAIFIAAFMRVMGKYGWLKTAVVSVGVSVALFWLFELQFLVPLPKGPVEAWFGY